MGAPEAEAVSLASLSPVPQSRCLKSEAPTEDWSRRDSDGAQANWGDLREGLSPVGRSREMVTPNNTKHPRPQTVNAQTEKKTGKTCITEVK